MIYLRFIDTQQRIFMYHIVFNADENYIKYCAVLMYSIIKHTDSTKQYPFSQNGGGCEPKQQIQRQAYKITIPKR